MNMQANIEQYFSEYIDKLRELIACDSVLSDDALPFGSGVNRALDTVLEIAKSWGFKTYCAEDRTYGYAEIGSGDRMMGILGHIDVVSVGDVNAWTYPPFELTEVDGMLYGRGVQDDKGPMLATLFALKLLLDNGATLKHRVRFIFGTDEENLWRCIERYKQEQELPDFGITPDADFPLVQVEKGTVQYVITSHGRNLTHLEGGVSMNAVPNFAKTHYNEKLVEALKASNRNFEVDGEWVNVKGVAAHASTPEKGKNAIVHLAKALNESGDASRIVQFICDLYTLPIFDRFYDRVSGYLSFNVGIVKTEADQQYATLDIRFPVSFEKFEVKRLVEAYANKYNLVVEEHSSLPSLYVSEKSEFFAALLGSYQDVTGDKETKPLKIGGATYARSMPNIVAYGPLLPGSKMTAHQVDESISVSELKTAIEIYVEAFTRLVVA